MAIVDFVVEHYLIIILCLVSFFVIFLGYYSKISSADAHCIDIDSESDREEIAKKIKELTEKQHNQLKSQSRLAIKNGDILLVKKRILVGFLESESGYVLAKCTRVLHDTIYNVDYIGQLNTIYPVFYFKKNKVVSLQERYTKGVQRAAISFDSKQDYDMILVKSSLSFGDILKNLLKVLNLLLK